MLSVEEVAGRTELRRFVEVPFALFGSEPRWAPPVVAYERARLDGRRNPALDGDARYLLVRRMGRIVGRLLVVDDGRFGCFDAADAEAAVALLAEAGPAAEAGGTGPDPFGDGVPGVLVDGFDVAGVTGRQWHPPWYAEALRAAGLTPTSDHPTWVLAARPGGAPPAARGGARGGIGVAGPYADPRLVLDGITAVPDVAPVLREAGPRSAWRLARRARAGAWERCVVVRVDGDPAELVPGLLAAAGNAGYRSVVAPWCPDDRPPDTLHQTFSWR